MKNWTYLAFLNFYFAIGCTTGIESKPCICEAVVAQPSKCDEVVRPDLPVINSQELPTSDAVPTTVTQFNHNEIEEMNAPALTSRDLDTKQSIQELPESSSIIEETDNDTVESGRELVVQSNGLNVRSGPSMESQITGSLKQGTEVKMLSREGIWVMIGEERYVSIKHLKEK